jgi:hypothetical protein
MTQNVRLSLHPPSPQPGRAAGAEHPPAATAHHLLLAAAPGRAPAVVVPAVALSLPAVTRDLEAFPGTFTAR